MFHHKTVLREEAVDGLQVRASGTYVDCTLGGGGHSRLIAERLGPQGTLIGLDQDDRAINWASKVLADVNCKVKIVRSNFQQIDQVLDGLGIADVDGVLFDLGVSSPQLDEGERGFSYQVEAPLDMRMDRTSDLSAYEIVNGWSEEELTRILRIYGEERFARRIARAIGKRRESHPIETTTELAEIVKGAIPAATRRRGPHPARRTFQAIRIAVNDELNVFQTALERGIHRLRPRGRVCVITFHSLEDRICKKTYQERARSCICPPDFPVCTCEQKQVLEIITKKPIIPRPEEVEANPRARSAKLRIAEKC